jgi:hypothetical protein
VSSFYNLKADGGVDPAALRADIERRRQRCRQLTADLNRERQLLAVTRSKIIILFFLSFHVSSVSQLSRIRLPKRN